MIAFSLLSPSLIESILDKFDEKDQGFVRHLIELLIEHSPSLAICSSSKYGKGFFKEEPQGT